MAKKQKINASSVTETMQSEIARFLESSGQDAGELATNLTTFYREIATDLDVAITAIDPDVTQDILESFEGAAILRLTRLGEGFLYERRVEIARIARNVIAGAISAAA